MNLTRSLTLNAFLPLPMEFGFDAGEKIVTADLAFAILDSIEQTLVERGLEDRYCLNAIVFNTRPPQRFLVTELALLENPFLQI